MFLHKIKAVLTSAIVGGALCTSAPAQVPAATDPIVPLKISGEQYVDPAGKAVRFWGVNLVATYPDHATADALAANLASRQVNLVRPHHNLRRSADWNPGMTSGALLAYQGNSREFDAEALERFDYLNAALRKNGIYLAMSMHWSRSYLPGDVDILATTDDDRKQWMAAMEELNGWDWKKAIDVRKLLPAVDERAALLSEEFLTKLLAHTNPHTGRTYASDPQIISFEVVNESSAEYAIICGNRFPDYWQNKLVEKWQAYARAAGIEGGDLYKPADNRARTVRARFLRKLDEDYFDRMKAVLRAKGSTAPLTMSNLWRGENNLQLHAERADFIEAHMYGDPLVTRTPGDWIGAVSNTRLAGKPFFIGELNQAEGQKNIDAQSPQRTMLPLSAAAYGSFQEWSGMIWFAWSHGTQAMGPDGWAAREDRQSNLGRMVQDGMQLDHLRTAGILFRQGLVAGSRAPMTITVSEPLTAGNYNDLMRQQVALRPGWTGIHALRKTFGPAPTNQATAPWLTQNPPAILKSDTGQIIKDTTKQQLLVVAPAAEAFSGTLAQRSPSALRHLSIAGDGFVTVIAVADDQRDLADTQRLVLSRTALDANHQDTAAVTVALAGLKAEAGKSWHVRVTRPRAAAAEAQRLTPDASGRLALPAIDWHECELELK